MFKIFYDFDLICGFFQLPPAPQIELILEKTHLGVLKQPLVRIRRKHFLETKYYEKLFIIQILPQQNSC